MRPRAVSVPRHTPAPAFSIPADRRKHRETLLLSGTGTVTANVQNAAMLDMGASVGILTITGSYTQLPAGQLTARLGGLSAGTQYDQLTVTGAASLDGTLALVLVSGYTPATGDTFTVLTCTSETGSFTIDGAGQPYTASYEAIGVAIAAN